MENRSKMEFKAKMEEDNWTATFASHLYMGLIIVCHLWIYKVIYSIYSPFFDKLSICLKYLRVSAYISTQEWPE